MGVSSEMSSKRILVVEDNDEIRELLVSVFSLEGYNVDTVADGGKALDVLCKIKPDLVTLDLSLPGKNGEEILRDIRQDPRVSCTPVIIISAYVERMQEEERNTAQHIISKPFEILDVLNKVEGILGQPAAY